MVPTSGKGSSCGIPPQMTVDGFLNVRVFNNPCWSKRDPRQFFRRRHVSICVTDHERFFEFGLFRLISMRLDSHFPTFHGHDLHPFRDVGIPPMSFQKVNLTLGVGWTESAFANSIQLGTHAGLPAE